MKISIILFCFVLFITGCNNALPPKEINKAGDEKSNEFYHYSIWAALVNKIYDGSLTVKEAKTHGDTGIGTYNGVDGELVMIDGVLYQVPSSGKVIVATDSMLIPYLNTTFFDKEISYELNDRMNYDSLRKIIQRHFPSRNFFYAFKIHGEFDTLKLGSMQKQKSLISKVLTVFFRAGLNLIVLIFPEQWLAFGVLILLVKLTWRDFIFIF